MLQKEKEAAKRLQQEEEAKAAAALAVSPLRRFTRWLRLSRPLYHRLYLPHPLQTSTPFLLAMSAKMVRHPQKTAAWQLLIIRLKTLACPQRKKNQKNPNPTKKAMLLSTIAVALP